MMAALFNRSLVASALVFCLLATPALAEDQQGPLKIAVLEFTNLAGLTAQEAAYVPDVIRGEATALPRKRYLIMTRDNILAMLPPGTDLSACEADCEIETGRNVGAEYVVSGQIIRFGTALKVSMKLYETRGGALLASERASANTVDELERPVVQAARRMLGKLTQGEQEVQVQPTPPPPPVVQTPPLEVEPAEPPAAPAAPRRESARFALRFGVVSATFDDNDTESGATLNTADRGGYALMGSLIVPLDAHRLALQLEGGVVSRGSAIEESDAEYTLNYVEALSMLRYQFGDRAFRLYGAGGFGLGVLSSATFTADGFDETDISEDITGLDVSLALAVGLDLYSFSLEIRAQRGLTSAISTSEVDVVNNTRMILLGYIF